MNRKILTGVLLGILAALMIPAVSLANTFQISTKKDLLDLAARVNRGESCTGDTYELTADIAVGGDWTPIGVNGDPFNGTFDGKGFKVTGYNVSNVENAGFFYKIASGGAVINTDFYGTVSAMGIFGNAAGGIAFFNYGTIMNCSFSGPVSSSDFSGGLVCVNYGLVRNCFSAGTISTTTSDGTSGGIAAGCGYGSLQSCYSTAKVTGGVENGGIVGRIKSGQIDNCYWLSSGCANGYGFFDAGSVTNMFSFDSLGILTDRVGGSNVLLDVLNAYAQPDLNLMVWVAGTDGYTYPVLEYGTYEILAVPVDLDYGSATVDYTQPAAQTITVTNTGNKPVTLTQPTAANYTVGALSAISIVPAGTATFTVQPKAGLAAGVYDDTITVTGSNGVSASVQFRFAVTAATPAPTSTPTPTPTPAPTPTPTPIPYRVISGAGGVYHQQGPSGLIFTANGDFSHFSGVQVDSKPVDESSYNAREGSTIITLRPDYLDTLTLGTHQLRIEFTDGYADASFTVAKELDPEMPPTGDRNTAAFFAALMILSATALIVLRDRRRRANR